MAVEERAKINPTATLTENSIIEHGVPVPDELVDLYHDHPELFEGLGAREQAFLKGLMGNDETGGR